MSKKNVFSGVAQVAVVVKNCDASVKIYADEYGIGPWSIYEFNPKTVSDMIIRGKHEEYAMRLAVADIGGVQWELIEPKDEKSIYYEFLQEHGEGIHHVLFNTEDYDKTMEFHRERGHKVFQGGTWAGLTYSYLDTRKDLGFIAETYKAGSDFVWPTPDAVYPPE